MNTRIFSSLRARLLLWLLVPLGVAAILNISFANWEARKTATMVQDRMLLGSARIIAQQIRYDEGLLEVAIPPAALELFQSADQDRVYYRIASGRGVLLSGYAELPPPPSTLRPEESLYFSTIVRDQPVRVVAYAQPVFAAPEEGPVVIEVAQTYEGHQRMIQQILATSLHQDFWMLALVAVLVWIALRGGLKGILRLRDEVRDRTPGSLEPLDLGPVPKEILPLVEAINSYVQRLDHQMALRSRFITNASHQLRTPFTILQTQVNFGLNSHDLLQKDEALRAIFKEVRHGSRLVNQLLSLVYVLLALAVFIAVIGIANTLLLSVFERTHEIGLLRAVGMRRRQVRSMIRAESVILSIFGALIGVVVGTGLGVAFAASLKQQGITDIVIPFSKLILFLIIAALLGLAAASWPARRAARLDILAAIAAQ